MRCSVHNGACRLLRGCRTVCNGRREASARGNQCPADLTGRTSDGAIGRMRGGQLFLFPLLDGVRQETGFLVGIRGVVMFFLENLQGIVTGGGFGGGVSVRHGSFFRVE